MKMEQLTLSNITPRWAGSYTGREHLLSGGVKLDAAAFTAVNGKKPVPAGTLVGKTFAETTYGPAAAGDDQFGYVLLDVADALVNADAELYISGEVRVNRLPAQPAAALLTATKQQFTYTEGR